MLRPYWLTALVSCLFAVWVWISLTTMDYHGESFFWGLQTSPWFYFSLPFTIMLCLVLSFAFAHIARRSSVMVATCLVLILGLPWLVFDFLGALPDGRVRRWIPEISAAKFHVVKIQQRDSFSDGQNVQGELVFEEDPLAIFRESESFTEKEEPEDKVFESLEAAREYAKKKKDIKRDSFRFVRDGTSVVVFPSSKKVTFHATSFRSE